MSLSPLRLNLGSGPRATPGWQCIDRSPNIWLSRHPALKSTLRRAGLLSDGHMSPWDRDVIRGDILNLKYADASAEFVYSSHVLEHLYLGDARRVLSEAHRVLRPGGLLRLALPDSTVLAQRLVDGERAGDADPALDFNRRLLAFPEARPRGVRAAILGRAAGHVHRWQPTPAMVRHMLVDAGFENITDCQFRVGRVPDLDQIETRPESFFVEGTRP
jgi:SAM-dependent methyltransferase